jgi:hypothetical protein
MWKMSSYNTLGQVMTLEEEKEYYDLVLCAVIENPRRYLDNLETLDEFRVSFIDYRKSKGL